MRPCNSAYDRDCAIGTAQAEAALEADAIGTRVEYEAWEACDDQGRDAVRARLATLGRVLHDDGSGLIIAWGWDVDGTQLAEPCTDAEQPVPDREQIALDRERDERWEQQDAKRREEEEAHEARLTAADRRVN